MAAESRVLICWIGHTDLRAADGVIEDAGPVGQAVTAREFDRVYLVCDYPAVRAKHYVAWLSERTQAPIHLSQVTLSSPVAFGEVYEHSRRLVARALEEVGERTTLTYHLSPGTWAMAATWFVLAKTRFPAELIESSRQSGLRTADIPFDLSVDFLPDMLAAPDARLRAQVDLRPDPAPEFSAIVHRSKSMARVIDRAGRVALRNVPVLIHGESGTGKELFARAIHQASLRRSGPFVAVNCGAIPQELVESELFGHERGAFTGAIGRRDGHFRAASKGTLFLDEVGELPPAVQVKLLRVLQEQEVTPVGASEPVQIDVRIVCATHRDLVEAASDGEFRMDLFYRLAVAVLVLPPLRERRGDISLLADALLAQINSENRAQPGYVPRRLTAGAKNLLKSHHWPGNVRELQNSLQRAALWSDSESVGISDIRDALASGFRSRHAGVLDRSLGNDFSLPDLLGEVAKAYLKRAVVQTEGNKTKAADLLGLKSHQVLSNWLKRHGIE
jgi:DNA-binding NtrC family response regulator